MVHLGRKVDRCTDSLGAGGNELARLQTAAQHGRQHEAGKGRLALLTSWLMRDDDAAAAAAATAHPEGKEGGRRRGGEGE